MTEEYLKTVREKGKQKLLLLPHAIRRMKCMYCKTEMKSGTAPFYIDRKGLHITLDEVPAWVCPQCGEVYFEDKEVDSVQALIRVVEEKSQNLPRQHSGCETRRM